MWLLVGGSIVAGILGVYIILKYLEKRNRVKKFGSKRETELIGKHVVITGGSSGIGLNVAIEVAKRGANISIIARSKEKLSEAKRKICGHFVFPDRQKVVDVSVDISAHDTSTLDNELKGLVSSQGPIFMVVNCAGFSIPSKLETLTTDQIRSMMDINYFGSVNVTKSVLADMKSNNNGGVIVFVSSLAGLVGLFGFTAYSASKFAIRGFAEALAMEVAPYGITVTVNCPPDTDTPGLQEEEKYKPEETKLISESAGLFKPDVVAKTLVDDALAGKFLSSNGVDGFMLTNLCSGMGPSSLSDVIVQSLTMSLFRVVAWCHVQYFNSIVKKCNRNRNENKKSE